MFFKEEHFVLKQADVIAALCRILFGFMTVTCFLSMWLSNTACAAVMIPIACAVLKYDHRTNMTHKFAATGQ